MTSASQALNETRLPRAILRRSEDLARRFQRTEGSPPADPSAAPVEETPALEAETPRTPESDPRESDPAYWRQRFKVTEGVLRAERERHSAAVGALRQQLSELQAQVQTLQASKSQPETVDIGAYFTPDQIEQFGEEQCAAMAAAAQKAAQQHVQKAVEAEVKPLRERRAAEDADQAAAREQKFIDDLIAIVPNYLEIDADPGWIAWLRQDDPASGMQRQKILTDHVSARSANKVGSMFKKYLAESKPETPKPPVTPHGTGGSGGSDVPQVPASTKGYPSPAEIKAYYKDAALGKVSEAERGEFEARLKLKRA